MTKKNVIRAIGVAVALLALLTTGCSIPTFSSFFGALSSIFGGAGIVST